MSHTERCLPGGLRVPIRCGHVTQVAFERSQSGDPLARSLNAGVPYEMPCSASGTISGIDVRSASRVLHFGSSSAAR